MALSIGGTGVSNVKLGSSQVTSIYQGSNLVWSNATETSDPHWASVVALWPMELGGLDYTQKV